MDILDEELLWLLDHSHH